MLEGGVIEDTGTRPHNAFCLGLCLQEWWRRERKVNLPKTLSGLAQQDLHKVEGWKAQRQAVLTEAFRSALEKADVDHAYMALQEMGKLPAGDF